MKKIIKAEMYKTFNNKIFIIATVLMLLFVALPLFIGSNTLNDATSGIDFFHKIISSSQVFLALIVVSLITIDYTGKTIKI